MNDSMIRPAEPGDYRVIINAVDEWWGGRQMMQMLPKLFFVHFRSTSFVAENDGHIVGFVVGFLSQSFGNEGYIHFLGIHPDFRRSGLGRILYGRVFESMMDRGCSLVRCVTSPQNKGSIAFYLRMGFKPEESQKSVDGIPVFDSYDGPGEDRVLFSKALV